MAYKKGYSFERELKEYLTGNGWSVIRSGGSKKPDLVAAKDGKIMVIECKVTKDNKVYLAKEEVLHLKKVAEAFSGECMFAIKRKNKKWSLVDVSCLKETACSFVAVL